MKLNSQFRSGVLRNVALACLASTVLASAAYAQTPPAATPAAPAATPAPAAPAKAPPVKMAPLKEGSYALSVSNERLLNAINEPQNWITSNGNLESWRYSQLNQINRSNVAGLHMAWAMSLGGANDVNGVNGPNVMANPLVDNGQMYAVSEWGRVFKIDVTNPSHGDLIWISDPAINHEANASLTRGIALYGTNVYNALLDGRVVAINRDTGEIVWDKQVGITTQYGAVERFNSQPLAAENKILVSNGAGDGGTNGWLSALDPATGKEIWRWNAIPKPGEPGSETWKDANKTAWQQGGGGMWTTGSYDKTTRSAIWGVANPTPIYDPQYRPGDNLYTDSTVSVNIDNGKLNWYFQYTPNDGWDYDENGVNMVQDIKTNGQTKRTIGHFGRNGFYYDMNATDGKFLSANQYAQQVTWTAGIDASGKPVEYDPKLGVQTYIPATRVLRGDPNKTVCPTWHGGIAMQPPAFNPVKQIAYAVGTEGCFTENGGTGLDDKGNMVGRTFTSDLYYGGITSVDAVNNKVLHKVTVDTEVRSGVLSTAGGLIFTALTSGDIVAYNDETLQELWRFNMGTPMKAPPMTYSINGKQFIAIQSSGLHVHPKRYTDLMHSAYLFVFALDDPRAPVAGSTSTN